LYTKYFYLILNNVVINNSVVPIHTQVLVIANKEREILWKMILYEKIFNMKKFIIGTSVLLGSLIAPSFAEERNNFYLSIGGGVAYPSDIEGDTIISGAKIDAKYDTKNPNILGFAVGKKFDDWRLEANYAAGTWETDSITLSQSGNGITASITPNLESDVKSYMIYGYKDFKSKSLFTPYIGVGLGTATAKSKDTTVSVSGTDVVVKGGSESLFTYGLKAGLDYKFDDFNTLYGEVTYQNLASYTISEAGFADTNYDSSNFIGLTFGLKFNFWLKTHRQITI